MVKRTKMKTNPCRWAGLLLLGALVASCSDDTAAADGPVGPPEAGVDGAAEAGADAAFDAAIDGTPDQTTVPALTVAAIQYDPSDHTAVTGCTDSLCGAEHFVREAASQGAALVVLPSYAIEQDGKAEATPGVGTVPETPVLQAMSDVASSEQVTVVFTLLTWEENGDGTEYFQTVVALDQSGTVIAVHRKFELHRTEQAQLTAGASIATSCFDTPAGKACMIDGADVQCVVTEMTTTSLCTSHAIDMLNDLISEQPQIMVFTNYWMVGGSNPTWQVLNVCQKLATDWNVWVVSANTTKQPGMGGGIWKPGGEALETTSSNTPSVVLGQIPLE